MEIPKCQNCGAAMSCTCQTRKSIDGVVGCTNCIGNLNNAARQKIAETTNESPNMPPPVINSAVLK